MDDHCPIGDQEIVHAEPTSSTVVTSDESNDTTVAIGSVPTTTCDNDPLQSTCSPFSPKNSFMKFRSHLISSWKADGIRHRHQQNVSKLVAAQWAALSEREKNEWKAKADAEWRMVVEARKLAPLDWERYQRNRRKKSKTKRQTKLPRHKLGPGEICWSLSETEVPRAAETKERSTLEQEEESTSHAIEVDAPTVPSTDHEEEIASHDVEVDAPTVPSAVEGEESTSHACEVDALLVPSTEQHAEKDAMRFDSPTPSYSLDTTMTDLLSNPPLSPFSFLSSPPSLPSSSSDTFDLPSTLSPPDANPLAASTWRLDAAPAMSVEKDLANLFTEDVSNISDPFDSLPNDVACATSSSPGSSFFPAPSENACNYERPHSVTDFGVLPSEFASHYSPTPTHPSRSITSFDVSPQVDNSELYSSNPLCDAFANDFGFLLSDTPSPSFAQELTSRPYVSSDTSQDQSKSASPEFSRTCTGNEYLSSFLPDSHTARDFGFLSPESPPIAAHGPTTNFLTLPSASDSTGGIAASIPESKSLPLDFSASLSSGDPLSSYATSSPWPPAHTRLESASAGLQALPATSDNDYYLSSLFSTSAPTQGFDFPNARSAPVSTAASDSGLDFSNLFCGSAASDATESDFRSLGSILGSPGSPLDFSPGLIGQPPQVDMFASQADRAQGAHERSRPLATSIGCVKEPQPLTLPTSPHLGDVTEGTSSSSSIDDLFASWLEFEAARLAC